MTSHDYQRSYAGNNIIAKNRESQLRHLMVRHKKHSEKYFGR